MCRGVDVLSKCDLAAVVINAAVFFLIEKSSKQEHVSFIFFKKKLKITMFNKIAVGHSVKI